MQEGTHSFTELFAQLGLPNDHAGIEAFLAQHRPLPNDVSLVMAPFWSLSQASFLREQWRCDADWSTLVDELDVALRVRG